MKKSNPILIMTLLVRDEADIIRQNIEFHYKKGVDFIIATNNASVDETREILQEFAKKGKLHLIDELGQDKNQAAWNNRMAKLAIEKYEADAIFHCDADEFWSPKNGNLKSEIFNSKAEVFSVNIVNILLEDKNGEESFPRDAKYAVVNPIETSNLEEDSKKQNLYFFRYPQKVMFKTGKYFFRVSQGNHSIENLREGVKQTVSDNIEIYHFPLRGKKRFFDKVVKTGKAVEKNVLLSEKQSWHIRRWYSAYKNGKLDEEYKKLVITKEKANELMAKGMIVPFDFQRFISH